MKSKEIRELISFLAESGLNEVNIETEEIKLYVKRTPDGFVGTPIAMPMQPQSVAVAPAISAQESLPSVAATQSVTQAAVPSSNNYVEIKSPMIGTFYRAGSPEADSFVNVGDSVSPGKVVCIIEAMKLFNEIESEISGKIVKVLVENASPVEYDQPLFLVDPS